MKNDKRERILDAAEQLMSQMQNREISVNMIAKEAQIGKGSVYYYFESKEEIIEAVVERCYKRIILEFFSEMQTGSSAIDKIKLLFRSVVKEEFFGKQKNLIGSLHLHEDARQNEDRCGTGVCPSPHCTFAGGLFRRLHLHGNTKGKCRNDCGNHHFLSGRFHIPG